MLPGEVVEIFVATFKRHLDKYRKWHELGGVDHMQAGMQFRLASW